MSFSLFVYLFAIVCIASVCFLALTSMTETPAHDFRNMCHDCHLNTPVSGVSSGTPMLFTKDIDVLCLQCHARYDDNSHPVGMKPSMNLPADMPVSSFGVMTCVTCHYPHAIAGDAGSKRNPFLLRRPNPGKPFCVSCHPKDMRHLNHASVLVSAHSPRNQFLSKDASSLLDRQSLECVGCHDDSLVPGADMNIHSGIWYHASGIWHPIGVKYPTSYPGNKYYHPISELNPSIRLVDDDIVGCSTCHNKFSDNEKYLVISNKNSRLCLACHIR